ncbi:MAG: ferritin-like domain-containing protein [Candidatus Hodarchaeota archaeon]
MSFLSSTEEELISFFREQVKLEEKIVESLSQTLETVTNPVAKGVLKGISLDSLKHAEIYKAAIEISSAPQALTEEEFYCLKQDLKRHIENEERVIGRLQKAIKETRNEKLNFLLESIVTDEERHHALLNEIMDIVVRGETITEGDWWDFLWRNVPFHGAPGG